MAYLTVAIIRQDPWIRDRVASCVAVENMGADHPEGWATDHAWELAAQPGWAAAWEYAVASHPEEDYQPGKDAAVVTDAQILSAVQAIRSEETGNQGGE